MYPLSHAPLSRIKHAASHSLNRRIVDPDCSVDDVKAALEEGFNPNTWWESSVIVEAYPYLRWSALSWELSWVNINTPLHKLLRFKKFDAATVLLNDGAQTEIFNAIGRTPMHEAVINNLTEVVRFLIENGADVNAVSEAHKFKDEDGFNYRGTAGLFPLHEAIRNQNCEITEMLIIAGANYNRTSLDGWTILDLAFLHRDESVINLLLQHNAQLSQQTASGQTEAESLRESARLLLAYGALFPSNGCRQAYLHVINRPEFIQACKASPASRKLSDTFLDLLSQAAELPNPEDLRRAPCCVRCVSYLEYLSPGRTGPFELFSNRCSLTQSAKDGCCLCAIFEDALENDAASGSRVSSYGDCDDQKSSPVQVEVDLGGHRVCHFTVSCEEQRKKVDIYPMSGKQLLLVPPLLPRACATIGMRFSARYFQNHSSSIT